MSTTTAASVAAAAAKKAAANKSAAADANKPAKEPKTPKEPKLDKDGNPVVRKPPKPKHERLVILKEKLANHEVESAKRKGILEAAISKLESSTAPKVASKDEVLAAAPEFGATQAQIKANIAKKIAELKALQKGVAEVSDDELSAASDESDDEDAGDEE